MPQILTGRSTLATSSAHDARLLSFGGLGLTPQTRREGTSFFFAEMQGKLELMVIDILQDLEL